MLLPTLIGLLSSVLFFSTLVAGEVVLTLNSVTTKTTDNEFFDPLSLEIVPTKKSSQLSGKFPAKKDFPDTIMLKITVVMSGQDPIEYETTLCDALEDDTGKSFSKAGLPKGEFPQGCPFKGGDWSVSKWNAPTEKIPQGVPDGPISGSVLFMEEGKDAFVTIEFEGEIKHAL